MAQVRELFYPNFVFGGDSSKWDDIDTTPQRPDFQKAYDLNWRFNYLKATQGVWVDQDYQVNWMNSRATPLKLGVYHFLQWNIDPKEQAEFFWNTVKNDPGELPLICDFEWWQTTPSNAMDILYNFLERMKQLCGGKRLGIYTAKSFWNEHGSNSVYWKQYDLWIAHYQLTPPLAFAPWTEWFMWQYTGHGDGLYYGMESNDVDLDYANEELFEKYTGDITVEPPPPAEEPTALKMIVQVPVLNVRDKPSTTGNIVDKRVFGEVITVYDVAGINGAWVQIDPDKSKWCCVQNLYGTYLIKEWRL